MPYVCMAVAAHLQRCLLNTIQIHHAHSVVLQAAAAQMEGYDASDMAALMDRATLSAARRRLSVAPPVTMQLPPPKPLPQPAALRGLEVHGPDLAAARQGFSPAAFWGVGRPVDATAAVQARRRCALPCVSLSARHCLITLMAALPSVTFEDTALITLQGWEDVGGLADVKAALREALELPARASALVASAPLRLRTGALLYGPPGCGKTHVGEDTALVSACIARVPQ